MKKFMQFLKRQKNQLEKFNKSMATVQGLVAADTQSPSVQPGSNQRPVGKQPRGSRRPGGESTMAETTNPMNKTPTASYKPTVVGKAKQARANVTGSGNEAIVEVDVLPSHAL